MPQDARNVTEPDLAPGTDPGEPAGTATGRSFKPRQPELTKVSANFVPRAIAALDLASEITGDSRTDVLNRAVQVYAYLVKAADEGSLVFVENPATGIKDRVVFL